MLIYTQPGNCPACGGVLRMLPKHDGGTVDPVELFICDNCNNINESTVPLTVSTESDCTLESNLNGIINRGISDGVAMMSSQKYEELKRRAALWDDLKHVLKNGTWSSPDTIDAVLTNMDYMEYESTHKTGKDADAEVD